MIGACTVCDLTMQNENCEMHVRSQKLIILLYIYTCAGGMFTLNDMLCRPAMISNDYMLYF